MAKRQKLDYSVRQDIVKLHKEKHTIREISEKVKRSKSVLGRIVKSYNDTGKKVSVFKTARSRETSAREDRIMQGMSLKDRFKFFTEIKRVMNSTSYVNVSRQTVSRRLQEIGMFNRTPRKKPLVSSKNKRLEFANRYVIWTYENWAKVFFSDESKFNLFGNNGKNNVKRCIGERLSAKCTKKTVKFGGGSVMVFGMFSSQGTTPLVRLQTRVNAQIYKNIVQDHVVPIIQNSGFDRATFKHDNAPCHKGKVVMSYLSEQDFEIMDWTPQSPDLNPLENLWKTLGVKVMERTPTNTEDFRVKLQEEWSKITIEDFQELIRSCSRRCAAVIESKGSFTKYWLYMYFYCFLAVYIVLNFVHYFWMLQIWKYINNCYNYFSILCKWFKF